MPGLDVMLNMCRDGSQGKLTVLISDVLATDLLSTEEQRALAWLLKHRSHMYRWSYDSAPRRVLLNTRKGVERRFGEVDAVGG